MATAPVKTQPLHNFPVSLKWVQRQAQAQPQAQAQQIQPSRPDSQDTDTSSDPEPPLPYNRVGPRSTRLQRLSFNSCSTSSSLTQRLDLQDPSLTSKNQADIQQENAARPWKLRPRKQQGPNGGGEVKELPPPFQPKSTRVRGVAELSAGNGGGANMENNKEKRKFWIALSREEIEEDVFIMTGSRPARRPRKRPKNIQKLLDSVFPGLWLVGTSADFYRLADTPVKR